MNSAQLRALPPDATETLTKIFCSADRNESFTTWYAATNRADLAGNFAVNLRAESAIGFDKHVLQNRVLEPIREAYFIE